MSDSPYDSPIESNLALLAQATTLLQGMPASLYQKSEAPVFLSSIGAHLRHVLDHYDSLFDGIASGKIDYHSRRRDPETETNPEKGLIRIQNLTTELNSLASQNTDLESPLMLRVSNENPDFLITTSLVRELYFSLSHTVHHYAVIGMIARHQGHEVPEEFGVAPSTLAFRRALADQKVVANFTNR